MSKAETFQTSISKECCIHLAVRKLAQPRLDVPAKIDDLEIGACTMDQRLPPQRCGADYSPFRQIQEGLYLTANKGVTRIFAFEEDRQMQPLWQNGWHIL